MSKDERAKRLAEQLRANLKKRKAQERGRDAARQDAGTGPPSSDREAQAGEQPETGGGDPAAKQRD